MSFQSYCSPTPSRKLCPRPGTALRAMVISIAMLPLGSSTGSQFEQMPAPAATASVQSQPPESGSPDQVKIVGS